MTHRERILSVYRGQTPDQVPVMLDLSHWFYQKNRMPWDLSVAFEKPEYELMDYHKKSDVGFYMPNLGNFFSIVSPEDVKTTVRKSDDGSEITWECQTPLGNIQRKRRWEEATYAWGISEWGVKTEEDLKVLAYALANRTFQPNWEQYDIWKDYVGDNGAPYIGAGYSGMGYLLNYWMGIEQVMYAAVDWPDTMHEVVGRINRNNLNLIDLLAESPAEIVCMGDNFSSDVQPPHFFDTWSRAYYEEAIRRLHTAGKYVAVHIDGKLRGALQMIREAGADCADAVTPLPMGDLTPEQCRAEAGPDFVLSGGVSPDLWLPGVKTEVFKQAVLDWLELKNQSPRLIANAGDQVPPGAVEDRIDLFRDLVAEYGRY